MLYICTGSIDRVRGMVIEHATPSEARDAGLHSSNTVAIKFTGPKLGQLQHLDCAAGEGLPLQDNN